MCCFQTSSFIFYSFLCSTSDIIGCFKPSISIINSFNNFSSIRYAKAIIADIKNHSVACLQSTICNNFTGKSSTAITICHTCSFFIKFFYITSNISNIFANLSKMVGSICYISTSYNICSNIVTL